MEKETYGELAALLAKSHVEEEPEDVLLWLAELLADTGKIGEETTVKATLGKLQAEAVGRCEAEDGGEEPSVYLLSVRLGNRKFMIEDYLL